MFVSKLEWLLAGDGNHERGPAFCYWFIPSIYHLADETILFHEVMRGFCHLWLSSLVQLLCQKPCLGRNGARAALCQPFPCILLKITVSMREALPAHAVASINKIHQYLQSSTKDYISHRPLQSSPCIPGASLPPWTWQRNHSIPTEISVFPELLVLILPVTIFVCCKQQTQRHLRATLLHIGHQRDLCRFNLLLPAHNVFSLTSQKEWRQA